MDFHVPIESSRESLQADLYTYAFTYSFFLPEIGSSCRSNMPDQCDLLPPSMEILEKGSIYQGGQGPNVSYALGVICKIRSFDLEGFSTVKSIEGTRAFSFLPCTMPAPPTDIHDFPMEFVLQASSTIKTRLLGRSIGVLTMAT